MMLFYHYLTKIKVYLMEKILILSTGGTLNKYYDPILGQLCVDPTAKALKTLSEKWYTPLQIETLIGKDSLEMTQEDRAYLTQTIQKSPYTKILIIHGTDTMELSAEYISRHIQDKTILFTGAMVPFSLDATEASANVGFALGALSQLQQKGVYIAMHGHCLPYDAITKKREEGRFVAKF